MAAKFRLIWDNRYFDAATLTAGSEVSGFPAVNVQEKLRKRVWRTTGVSGETLLIDMGETVDCSALALINHNLTCEGVISIEAAATSGFSTLLLDTEDTACHEIIGYGEGGYGMFGYGGAIPEELRPIYDPEPVRVIYFNEIIQARYWRLTMTDAGNSAGYLEVGRIFLCLHEEFARQMSYDAEYSGVDESQAERSLGGQLWIDEVPIYRTFTAMWKAFRREDLNWPFLHFVRSVGTKKYFVVDALPDGQPSDRHVMKLYCRLPEVPSAVYLDSKFRELALVFEEVL